MATGDTSQTAVQEFPSMAWMLAIPELAAILTNPTYQNNPNDQNQIMSAVEATNWWKTTSPSMRTYAELSAQDPAGLAQQLGQKASDVWDLYLKAGLTPDPAETTALATQALQMGWNSSQLTDAIVAHAATNPNLIGQTGQIQTNTQAIQQTAAQNGVALDPRTAQQWAITVQGGEHDLADYQTQLVNMAKNKYSYSPGITDALNKGISVDQYFQPYEAEAAKLLEVAPSSIDMLNSPQWAKVTDYTDPTTGARREMTIPEMSAYVKSMDAWKSTHNGQQAASQMAQGILDMFGKTGSNNGATTGFGAAA